MSDTTMGECIQRARWLSGQARLDFLTEEAIREGNRLRAAPVPAAPESAPDALGPYECIHVPDPRQIVKTPRSCGHKHRGLKAAKKCARSTGCDLLAPGEVHIRSIGGEAVLVRFVAQDASSERGRTISLRRRWMEAAS